MPSRITKSLLSLGAVILIILRIRWPDLKVDAITLGLLTVALLPWFFAFLESAEFPGGWKVKFRELRGVIEQQERQIETQQEIINQLIIFSMSQPIYEKLRALYYRKRDGGEYIYQGEYEDTNRREFFFLRDHGYLASARGGYFVPGEHMIGKDLVPEVELTPIGNFYVEQRQMLEKRLDGRNKTSA